MNNSKTPRIFLRTFFIAALISRTASEPKKYEAAPAPTYLDINNTSVVMGQGLDPTKAYAAGVTNPAALGTEMELSISCTNLPDFDIVSTSDPMCVTYIRSLYGSNWKEIHRTEVVKNNLNPTFLDKPLVPFAFEKKQSVMFKIYDVDTKTMKLNEQDYLGSAECNMATLVTRGKMTLPLKRRNLFDQEVVSKAEITIVAEKLIASLDKVHFELSGSKIAKKDFFGLSDPYLEIFKRTKDGQDQLVFKTEVKDNTLFPHWRPFHVLLKNLCNCDYHRQLKFVCWDYDWGGRRDYIGEFQTTLDEIHNQNFRKFDLLNVKKGNRFSGHIQIDNFELEEIPSFGDFIRGGLQMHGIIAIDFTSSNGHPSNWDSLHYRNPQGNTLNKYELAITSVVDILEDYDYDKRFSAYGFGGRHPRGSPVSFDFNLNSDNSECLGVQGVLAAYRKVLSDIDLAGATNFAPIIRKAAQIAASFPSVQDNYLILLILTDGEISDMPETQTAINDASDLPLSIIIVGIGNKSFANMIILDGDHIPMKNGVRVRRDIVQFVALKDYNAYSTNDTKWRLAKDVLAEVPMQLVSFMHAHNYKPRPPSFTHALSMHQQSFAAIPPAAFPPYQPQPQFGLPPVGQPPTFTAPQTSYTPAPWGVPQYPPAGAPVYGTLPIGGYPPQTTPFGQPHQPFYGQAQQPYYAAPQHQQPFYGQQQQGFGQTSPLPPQPYAGQYSQQPPPPYNAGYGAPPHTTYPPTVPYAPSSTGPLPLPPGPQQTQLSQTGTNVHQYPPPPQGGILPTQLSPAQSSTQHYSPSPGGTPQTPPTYQDPTQPSGNPQTYNPSSTHRPY